MVGKLYPLSGLPADGMTGAMAVSPGKSYKVSAKVGSKELLLNLPAKPGQFTTVVVKPGAISGFVSGNSLSSSTGASLDLINLTGHPVEFRLGGTSIEVGPDDSKSVEHPIGKVTIRSGASESVDADLGAAQIWGVYAIEKNGEVVLRTVSLKGSGQAAGTGGPTAS
ncbi:hypothetical protein EON82_05430 [bacterium]|nr:MAG: hypothetical protein EON82_05430 [bacterium]